MKHDLFANGRVGLRVGLCAWIMILSGCASLEWDLPLRRPIATDRSPVPRTVLAAKAFAAAEEVARETPGATVTIGRGNSMLPVYEDRTLLVIKKLPSAEWLPGTTVVFIGDQGWPVAHVLVRKAKHGWVAAGVSNRSSDNTRVTDENYVGTAFVAIKPTPTTLVADNDLNGSSRDKLREPALLLATMR